VCISLYSRIPICFPVAYRSSLSPSFCTFQSLALPTAGIHESDISSGFSQFSALLPRAFETYLTVVPSAKRSLPVMTRISVPSDRLLPLRFGPSTETQYRIRQQTPARDNYTGDVNPSRNRASPSRLLTFVLAASNVRRSH